jgi:hypothetical protein
VTPRQTSLLLTPATEAQIAELKRLGYGSTSAVIRTAVDRMHQTETATNAPATPAKENIVSRSENPIRIELRKSRGTDGGIQALVVWKNGEQWYQSMFQDVQQARSEMVATYPDIKIVNKSGYPG